MYSVYIYIICIYKLCSMYVYLNDFLQPLGPSCSFLLSPPVFHQLCWGCLNGNSLTIPLDRMRSTDDWVLAVLVVAGQETLWPTGSFLAGESCLGHFQRVGWLPTRPGMEALAWPEFMGIFPWLPREVLLPVQFSKWIMSSSPKLRRSGEMEMLHFVPSSLSWGKMCPFSQYCRAPPVTGSPCSF